MTRRDLLLVSTLALAGCSKPATSAASPNEWNGTVNEDPANDLKYLQGRWINVTSPKGGKSDILQYLVIKEDVAVFEFPLNVAERARPGVDRYIFILNSARPRKVMRLTVRLGDGEPIPGYNAPVAWWYTLNDDILTLWNQWADYGERPKDYYQRVSPN